MSQPPQGAGYFRAPKKLESKDEVIARVCAFLAEELGKKQVDNRSQEEKDMAADAWWEERGLRRYESMLWRNNFKASFSPVFIPCGPMQPSRINDRDRDYIGRYGHVRNN